jgi:pyruvate formate lyase activating enzyme
MVFGGIQKNSFIDYPEKISCVLFRSGCNFKCPYCHNPDMVNASGKHNEALCEKDIFDFLEKQKKFLDGVVISGGEPTLDNDLFLICKKIKALGYPIKLDTNGSRPDIIKRLIEERLIDYIAMDIKTYPSDYHLLTHKDFDAECIFTSICTIMASCLPYEFRTTCLKPFVDSDIIEKISNMISGSHLYVLQRFYDKKVLDPNFFRGKNFGYNYEQLAAFQSIAMPRVKTCIIR